MGSDVRILDFDGFFDGHTLKQLGGVAAGSDGGATAERLEYCLLDGAVLLVHLDLKFHDIAAGWRTYESSADILRLFV